MPSRLRLWRPWEVATGSIPWGAEGRNSFLKTNEFKWGDEWPNHKSQLKITLYCPKATWHRRKSLSLQKRRFGFEFQIYLATVTSGSCYLIPLQIFQRTDPSRGYLILEESTPFLVFEFFDNSLGSRKWTVIKMILVHGHANKFCIIKMQVIIPLQIVTHSYLLANSLQYSRLSLPCVSVLWVLLGTSFHILLVPSLISELSKIFDIC